MKFNNGNQLNMAPAGSYFGKKIITALFVVVASLLLLFIARNYASINSPTSNKANKGSEMESQIVISSLGTDSVILSSEVSDKIIELITSENFDPMIPGDPEPAGESEFFYNGIRYELVRGAIFSYTARKYWPFHKSRFQSLWRETTKESGVYFFTDPIKMREFEVKVAQLGS